MTVERWTDERLDELADIVDQTTHNIDLLVGAVNAFLERDRERSEEIQQFRLETEQFRLETEQFKLETEQYKRENDQRFNNLLEEVRFLIRQLGENR
jgi:predicted transcriptional regulator